MSVVVGMHLGSYVLIAADTRLTSMPLNGEPSFEDGRIKLRRVSMGFVAGVGLANLLDAVKHRLATEDITHTTRLIEIIHEERGLVPASWMAEERIQTAVEH